MLILFSFGLGFVLPCSSDRKVTELYANRVQSGRLLMSCENCDLIYFNFEIVLLQLHYFLFDYLLLTYLILR